jgi:hypothetical protein
MKICLQSVRRLLERGVAAILRLIDQSSVARSLRERLADALRAFADRLDPDTYAIGKPSVDLDGQPLPRCTSCGVPRGTLRHAGLCLSKICGDPDASKSPKIEEQIVPDPIALAKRFLEPPAHNGSQELVTALRALLGHIGTVEGKYAGQKSALKAIKEVATPALLVEWGDNEPYKHGFKKGAYGVARPIVDIVDRVLSLEHNTHAKEVSR